MRPRNLGEFVGQVHAVGPGTLIRSAVEADRIFSMILWGPPGCGKTTLARIVAAETRCHFTAFSAVLSGVKEIRAVIETARDQHRLHHRRTVLFVDEIHRFNKAQQDAFLQHVESGLITLIGATTENPSFEVIPALLSRCRVITLHPLAHEEMKAVLQRALEDEVQGLGGTGIRFSQEALDHLVELADGDVRSALNGLEIVAAIAESSAFESSTGEPISLDVVEQALQKKALRYDKGGEEHFNIISALHKSLRGSDPDAALYWLARMLAAGEDPFYVARRMVRFASEDVGNADPFALTVALNAMEAYRFLGPPEGELALAQAALYLATAPKSNRIYTAYSETRKAIDQTGALPVPVHLRNAPTRLMKDMGYGEGYRYAHDYPDAVAAQQHLPDALTGRRFYRPSDRGYEKTVGQRLEKWREIMNKNGSP
ncbi:MAG: replication-associated recombination protein A [Desulfobacterales bacterium]|nr:replication-associated recombination protein A [Desulfobacterales bacterium]